MTIGRPLPTYMAVILNEHEDELAPDGEIGEIGIAGIALARGYVNREELTKQKFVADFLNLPNNPSKRIYRTGDYGSIRDDGELEIHGRIDTQIKIRGYRVELGEIEAVLQQSPHIAQAVVNPYESEPGAVELVGYYTRKPGALKVDPQELNATLRKNLPCYMIPGYLEELPSIPMTANNKTDRKSLPAPKGPRFSAASTAIVSPRTQTEQTLVDALMDVMKIERVSVEDNFFQDLGAHSLLMARFGAEIRKRLHISSVSMQDLYLNPSIEKLANHLDTLPDEAADQQPHESVKASFHIPSNLSYYGCGALQLAWFIGWTLLGIWVFVEGIRWTYAAMPDLSDTYLRILGLSVGLFTLFSALPIAVKWLLIGKWKPETIPVWSLRYFRFWAVKSLLRIAPIAWMGDPMRCLYLRLLGAKIGKNALIRSRSLPVCTDLIFIGDNSVLGRDSIVPGYRARSNQIETGPIHIGSNAFVGEAGVVDINTTMEDDTQLGTSSSLHEGQRIPKGKRYHGCPGQETTADYCQIDPKICTPLRRWVYALFLSVIRFPTLPIPLMIVYLVFHYFSGFLFGLHEMPTGFQVLVSVQYLPLSFVLFFLGLFYGLIYFTAVPRFLNLFLEPDKTYVLYGIHYFMHEIIVQRTNSVFYNRLFGDSSAIVHYMKWVGWNLNRIIQTGSNFGMSQKHENPYLCEIGSGTMVSGGLKMINETMSNTSFKLSRVKVEEHNYLGNDLHIPADHKVGKNVLLATKTLVPIDGPIRENVGLLGSPAFEIPRATDRDKQMSEMSDEKRQELLREKNRYNFVTAILYLLNNWFLFFSMTLIGLFSLMYFPRFGMGSLIAGSAFAFCFGIFSLWLPERAVLGFGRLTPQVTPVLGEYFRFHERYWKLNGLWMVAPAFSGTPFKNVISRLQGVRLGRKVFDDGGNFDEDSLIEIGDYATVNAECTIQPHSLEEAVFKSDYVKIGTGCTLGVASNIHYGVTMGEYVVLQPNSFLMKGEIIDSDAIWLGNPAKAVSSGAIRIAPANTAEPLSQTIGIMSDDRREPSCVSY